MKSHRLQLSPERTYWPAVFSLFMGVTGLIAAEFIPVSLLTPISQELNITEGAAGQSVTVVGFFAVIASLTLAPLAKNMNRRLILLILSSLLVLSNILVALAPNYLSLLVGRCLLGLCVGGFWSMAPAVTLQLVPSKDISRAFSIIYAGVSVATIISLPLASYLEGVFGWRNVFFFSALLSIVALIWQFLSLPSLPAQAGNNFKNMMALLKVRWILAGIGAIIFSYGGYHLFFTYLRPFLEYDLALSAYSLSTVLLFFGLASCAGTVLAGWFLGQSFRKTMYITLLFFVLLASALFISNRNVTQNTLLIILWGFMFGFITVGWSTWIARTLADKAELIGGLTVGALQFSIGLAAAVGGFIFDNLNIDGIFITAVVAFILAMTLTIISFSLFTKVTGRLA